MLEFVAKKATSSGWAVKGQKLWQEAERLKVPLPPSPQPPAPLPLHPSLARSLPPSLAPSLSQHHPDWAWCAAWIGVRLALAFCFLLSGVTLCVCWCGGQVTGRSWQSMREHFIKTLEREYQAQVRKQGKRPADESDPIARSEQSPAGLGRGMD